MTEEFKKPAAESQKPPAEYKAPQLAPLGLVEEVTAGTRQKDLDPSSTGSVTYINPN